MDILTEHICYKSKISSNFELTTEEGQKDAVKAIRDVYDYKESVIMNESNLFTECESQYRELLLEREAIDKSNSFQSLAIQFKDNPERVHFGELKDAPYQDFNSFISAMIRFSRETDNLMRAERAATLQQIKDLTLKSVEIRFRASNLLGEVLARTVFTGWEPCDGCRDILSFSAIFA